MSSWTDCSILGEIKKKKKVHVKWTFRQHGSLFCSLPFWTARQTATVNVGDFANKIRNTVFITISYNASPWRQYKRIRLQEGADNVSGQLHSWNNTTNETLISNLKGQSSNTESGASFLLPGSTRAYSAENSLRQRLWACRKTDCVTNSLLFKTDKMH